MQRVDRGIGLALTLLALLVLGSARHFPNVPGQKVGIRLEFEEPMKSSSECALTIAGTPTGSVVTWSMDGKHIFLGKLMGLFMNMDKMLGSDLEKGLARIKTDVESAPG